MFIVCFYFPFFFSECGILLDKYLQRLYNKIMTTQFLAMCSYIVLYRKGPGGDPAGGEGPADHKLEFLSNLRR